VQLDATGSVTAFVPRGPAAAGSCHFVGVQIARADVFRDLPAAVPAHTIGGVYDALVARGDGAIRGFFSDARFFDVGTPGDYWRTSLALAGLDVPLGRGQRVDIADSAQVTRSILWDDVTVASGCRLDECIVTDGVRLRPGTSYRRAILRRDDGCGVDAPERIEHGVLVSPLLLESREPRATA
jgi:NDP-sugar pyrophosphorylase family protein